MKHYLLLLGILIIAACSNNTNGQDNDLAKTENVVTDGSTAVAVSQSMNSSNSEPIIGERIDGPANVRDTINGKLLFSLNDGVLVSCTPLKGDWYQVGILMEIDESSLEKSEFKKGQKIKTNGQEAGELLADIAAYTGTNGDESWAELIGYTHKDNIKHNSIIENALAGYMQNIDSKRTVDQFESFIQEFDLQKVESFPGYTIYCNNENWIDDPSPMWRIGLVFQNNQLVSILHSRPVKIVGTTDHKLTRGFDCLVYKDVENSGEIVKMFKEFVVSVD